MGITRPLPIGHYSGTPRDFAKELQNKEPSSDVPISEFLTSDKGSMYWSPAFREHADKMWTEMLKQYEEDFTKNYPLWCIGQSHIDVAWKWRFGQSIKKSQVTFGNAVSHMEHYPEFSFAGSQPCLFEMVLKTDPELFEKIKERVHAGQFELVGGCWVEADPRMPSGEAFVRQHLYGQRFFLRHFGKLAEIAWFQDSFGYSIQIPQYSVRSGMKYFFTNKIPSNKDTVFPFTHFHWISPDGSSLLAYQAPGGFGIITTFNKYRHTRRLLESGKSATFTYASDKPEEQPIWSNTLAPVLGAFYGKGDGGHGPTAEEYALIRYWIESGKNVRHVRAIEFFKEIENVEERLPAWRDELYYEFHRATLTTHHLVKFMNRQNEWATLAAESLATLACVLTDFRYPYEKLTRTWKNLCMMQMHDVLPGSSVPEVYDDCYDFWLLAREWLTEVRTSALEAIQKHAVLKPGKNGLLLFNPLFVPQNAIIEIPWGAIVAKGGAPLSLIDAEGRTFPIQVLAGDLDSMEKLERRPNRLIFHVPLEEWSAQTFTIANTPAKAVLSVKVQETDNNITLQNQFYTVKIDKVTGAIHSIILPESKDKRNPLPELETLAGPSNVLAFYEDFLLSEPAWNFNSNYRNMPLQSAQVVTKPAKLIEKGPIRWTVESLTTITSEEVGTATFTQRISLYNTAEGIDLDTIVNWRIQWTTTKCFFEIAGNPQESIAEVPYGTIHRSLHPTANHDKPRWENHMQTFLSIPAQDGSFCFHILNRGKYGFDNIDGNKIGITMIRSPMYPDVPASSWVTDERKARAKAGRGNVPEFADDGMHLIQLRLMPKRGRWETHTIERDAHAFNCPPIASIVGYTPFVTEELITTSEGIQAGSIKPTEAPNEALEDWDNPQLAPNTNTLVLRVYETLGTAHDGDVEFSPLLKIKKVTTADLVEQDATDEIRTQLSKNDGSVRRIIASWAPHEIKTFLLHRQ